MSLSVTLTATRSIEVFDQNITHNLTEMADAVGIYQAVWRPEECGITTANQLIPILEQGLAKLLAHPGIYRPLQASNGWGTYEQFIPWLQHYLKACIENPDALVHADR